MLATVWRRNFSSVRASATFVCGVVAASSWACSISPFTCPPVRELSSARNDCGISRETDLVSASTRKYSSSMPNLYSPDMVHLSPCQVVPRIRAPLQRTALSRASPRLRGIPAALRLKAAPFWPILSQVVASGNAFSLIWFPRGSGSTPVAEDRLDQRQRRDGCSIGAQNAGSEPEAHDVRQLEQCRPFGVGKATLGADQHARGQPPRDAAATRRGECRNGVLHVGRLVAKHEQPIRFPAARQRIEFLRRRNLRDGEDPALLGRLDGIRAHAAEI